MLQAPSLLPVALSALAVGVGIGVLIARGRRPASAVPRSDVGEESRIGECDRLRAQALDSVAEPVLVVGIDGRVRDANAAAMVLLDRPRAAVIDAETSVLRSLLTSNALPQDWGELVAMHAPWVGEAHVRLPDGSRRASPVRLVPVFAANGELTAMVEVYRELSSEPSVPADQFLRALDAGSDAGPGSSPADAADREIRLLALALADLERVVRQYELLLPAVRAEDPLAEAIAGLAAETSDMVASADVSRLLRELPRTLDRLRQQVQRLSESREAAGR